MTRSTRLRFLGPLVVLTLLACSADDPTAPQSSGGSVNPPPPVQPPPPSGGAGAGSNSYSKGEVVTQGKVTEFPGGVSVDGTLHLGSGENRGTFAQANLRVEYDANGRIRNVSGSATVPSPHERVAFANPVQADVGLFSGAFLNQNRDLGILLKDDTDYFVYRVRTAFEMRLATGETGAGAVKPVVVRPRAGEGILLVVDYRDPMYFVHGVVDGLGDAGIGWSRNGRIPFRPALPVAGLGNFDGRSTRMGTFPVFKRLSITGQVVDNASTEINLTRTDPWAGNLQVGYQSGFNGTGFLDLSTNGFVGIELPLAQASGGVRMQAGTASGVEAHAYVRGTTAGYSWWPTFLPVRPVNALTAQAFMVQSGDFALDMEGRYGWTLPFGTYAMTGSFHMSPDSAGLTGRVVAGAHELAVTSALTRRATTLEITPPTEVINAVANTVNKDIGEAIAGAQKAWEDLERATANYEMELSLRGLRSSIPAMVDAAKGGISAGISGALSPHRGRPYYQALSDHVHNVAAGYQGDLDALKAAALDIRDNDATRATLIRTLRNVASRPVFNVTYRYQLAGVTVRTVNISHRFLTQAQVDRLGEAADNAPYIKMTSDRKIRMQQVYSQVNGRAIFEKVRDEIENGVLRIPTLTSFGFEVVNGSASFAVFAVIDGRRETLGQVNPFDVPAMAVALGKKAVEVLLR